MDQPLQPIRQKLWTSTPASREAVERAAVVDGVWFAVLIQWTGGAILTGYALALGASPGVIGLMAALPLLVKLSQLYLSWRVERAGRWRRSTLQGALIARGALLLAAAIPLVPASNVVRVALLILALVLSNLGAAVYDVSWLTWMAELFPPGIRAGFFARRSRAMGLLGLAVGLVAAWGIDRWRDAHPGSLLGFAAAFGLGAAAGLIGLLWLRRIPGSRRTVSRAEGPSLREALAVPPRDPNFRWMLGFAAAWGVGMGIAGPYFTVYMLGPLKLSLFTVTAYTALMTLATSASQAHWGRLADHFGTKAVLRTGTFLFVLTPLPWLFAEPGVWWPLVLLHLLSGIASGAVDITMNALVLRLAPAERRASYLASYGATYSAAQAVAPLIGSVVLWTCTTVGLPQRMAFGALFVAAAVLRAAATPFLGRVHEPDGAGVSDLLRVMGRVRGMAAAARVQPVVATVYGHLARIADYISREHEPTPGRAASAS